MCDRDPGAMPSNSQYFYVSPLQCHPVTTEVSVSTGHRAPSLQSPAPTQGLSESEITSAPVVCSFSFVGGIHFQEKRLQKAWFCPPSSKFANVENV